MILVIGAGDQGKIIESCGTKHYMTDAEYCTIFNKLVPNSKFRTP